MQVTKTRVEIEDEDFMTKVQHKFITGTDGTEIKYYWANYTMYGKGIEIHLKEKKSDEIGEESESWSFYQIVGAGKSSNPIHGVTFVNCAKK